MNDLYMSDLNNGMVSQETLAMMHEAFGLYALQLNNANALSGGVIVHV